MRKNVAAKTLPRGVPRAFRKAFLYRGIFARIAAALGVSTAHVHRVATGERKSPAVEEAIRREIQRIEEAA